MNRRDEDVEMADKLDHKPVRKEQQTKARDSDARRRERGGWGYEQRAERWDWRGYADA
jgi:hypothetical protein